MENKNVRKRGMKIKINYSIIIISSSFFFVALLNFVVVIDLVVVVVITAAAASARGGSFFTLATYRFSFPMAFSHVFNRFTNKSSDGLSKFISKLLESREMAQVYHWTVKGDMGSHAAHLALQTYYEEVIEFIDDIVEIYQGQYGLIEGYDIIDTTDSKSKDRLDYFKEAVEFVKSERTCIKAEDTHIHNIVDELIALQYKTIYKLTYNK
jgi:hypothetical protein